LPVAVEVVLLVAAPAQVDIELEQDFL